MYRREPRYQLSFDDSLLPFGGKLSGDNRWINVAERIACEELEDDYEFAEKSPESPRFSR